MTCNLKAKTQVCVTKCFRTVKKLKDNLASERENVFLRNLCNSLVFYLVCTSSLF